MTQQEFNQLKSQRLGKIRNLQKIDATVLEGIKRQILYHFRKQGYTAAQLAEIERRADGYELYLGEDFGHKMSCGASIKTILVDKSFANVDSNGKFVSWKSGMARLIQSQIGHELIHAFSYMESDGCIGMKRKGNANYVAMNEGVTQMITEKVFGYTVSPNSDGYRNYKKIAKFLMITFGHDFSSVPKLLQSTFGDDNCIYDDFLFHTNKLRDKVNAFTGDNSFYDKLSARLNYIYSLDKEKIAKPSNIKTYDLIYEEMVLKIIIPRLHQMSAEDRKSYISELIKSVDDDIVISQKINNMIEKYYPMQSNELKKEVGDLEKKSNDQDVVNQYLEAIKNGDDPEKYFGVTTKPTGEIIAFTLNPHWGIVVENDELIEQISVNQSKKDMGNNYANYENTIKNALSNNKAGRIDCTDIVKARKNLATIKKIADENGYIVLNSLSEISQGQSFELSYIRNPKRDKKRISFEDLKKIVMHFDVEQDGNNFNKTIAVNRKTRKKIDHPATALLANFGAMWRSSAGVKWMDEEIKGFNYAFNEDAEEIFNQVMEISQKDLRETGTIDIENLIEEVESNSTYKHTSEIIRKLFSNQWKIQQFSSLMHAITPDAQMEVKNARNKYGFDFNSAYEYGLQELVGEGM